MGQNLIYDLIVWFFSGFQPNDVLEKDSKDGDVMKP